VSARTALDGARPIIARMDLSRGPDNTRADLIEVWSAVETALRSLVGDSSLSGQALIRDARARELLTFDQANALVAFLAAREQLDRPDYQPTDADVNAARSAFLKLDAGLMEGANAMPGSPSGTQSYGSPPPPPPSPYAPGGAAARKAAPPPPPIVPPAPGMEPLMRSPGTKRRYLLPVTIGIVVLAALVIGAWMMFGRGSGGTLLTDGIQAYQRGDKVTAASDFERAARATPNDAMPHVYLARMAREVGNYTVASQELQLALKAEPDNLTARREYGALFLSMGNYQQSRVWYVHALEIDPKDVTSQGWLGCTLVKLGRIDEGMTWIRRAGSGPWSACSNAALPTAPGTIRP
jgi:tetratricopeptide (TPR) repeat protein